jgi:8-oxo-dGTP pyrophosphatase MutT (NUDIX family)
MTREETILLLERYFPADLQEQKFKKEMLAFMQTHENCFERTLEIGHITASSWLLNKEGDKALLTHHAKLNRWFQLGGHCDGDPNVLAVALKEAQEESGIYDIKPLSTAIFDIDIHLIPENKKEKAHYHYDIRFLLQVNSDAVQISDESHALAWFGSDPTTLPPVDRSVLRMFNKWIEKKV